MFKNGTSNPFLGTILIHKQTSFNYSNIVYCTGLLKFKPFKKCTILEFGATEEICAHSKSRPFDNWKLSVIQNPDLSRFWIPTVKQWCLCAISCIKTSRIFCYKQKFSHLNVCPPGFVKLKPISDGWG